MAEADSKTIEPLDLKAVKAVMAGDSKTLNAMGTRHMRQLLAKNKLDPTEFALAGSRVLVQYRDAVTGEDPKERYPIKGSHDPQVLLTPFKDQFASVRVWTMPVGELLTLSVFYPAEKGWKLQEVWAGLYSYRGWTGQDYVERAQEAIKKEAWEEAGVLLAAGGPLRLGTPGIKFDFEEEYDRLFKQVSSQLDARYPRKVRLRGGQVLFHELDGFTDERLDAHAIPIVYFVHPKSHGPDKLQMAKQMHEFLKTENNTALLEEAPLVLYRAFTKSPVDKDTPFAATAIDMKTGEAYKPAK